MKVIHKKLYSESSTHHIEIYYAKPGDYILTVDGAFYSKHQTREEAIKEANRTAEWFGWAEQR